MESLKREKMRSEALLIEMDQLRFDLNAKIEKCNNKVLKKEN
jgi:hypothetical protein